MSETLVDLVAFSSLSAGDIRCSMILRKWLEISVYTAIITNTPVLECFSEVNIFQGHKRLE